MPQLLRLVRNYSVQYRASHCNTWLKQVAAARCFAIFAFFLFRSRLHLRVTESIQQRSFDLSSSSGDTVTRKICGTIRNLIGPYQRSGHRDSTAKKLVNGSARFSVRLDGDQSCLPLKVI